MKKIVLFFALLISLPSFAQDKNDGKTPPVRFGNITTPTATATDMLAFPRLLVMNPTCIVKSATITFMAGGKVFGPYKTDGPALTADEIAVIKKMQGASFKVAVEDIKVSCQGGPDMAANTIFLSCDH